MGSDALSNHVRMKLTYRTPSWCHTSCECDGSMRVKEIHTRETRGAQPRWQGAKGKGRQKEGTELGKGQETLRPSKSQNTILYPAPMTGQKRHSDVLCHTHSIPSNKAPMTGNLLIRNSRHRGWKPMNTELVHVLNLGSIFKSPGEILRTP